MRAVELFRQFLPGPMEANVACIKPDAPWVMCCACPNEVKTCEDKISDGISRSCPAHPEGIQLPTGDWVCSEDCYDFAAEALKAITTH